MWNLEELMDEIWHRCSMIRIYPKPQGQIPDYVSFLMSRCDINQIKALTKSLLASFIGRTRHFAFGKPHD
jgi:ribosome-interacting GTPase 1